MQTFIRHLLFYSILFSVHSSELSETKKQYDQKPFDIESLKSKFQNNIKKYTLKNGIRVILMKNGITPTIACYLKLGVGSSNESFDQAGVAHLLEHLLFKGTNQIGTTDFTKEKIYLKQIEVMGERIDKIKRKLLNPILAANEKKELEEKLKKTEPYFYTLQDLAKKFVISEEDSKAYSSAGGVRYNAYTSTDVTNYQIQLPKNRLELWAWLESSRFINPVFREFYTERKVIQEERKMRYDSRPRSLLYELYLKTAFGMSPYGKPVIGFESNIPRLKLKETKKFFREHYIPSRMVIGIVGDIEFEPTLDIIRKYFERIPSKKTPEFPPISYELQRVQRKSVLIAEHTPYMITGWSKPSVYHANDIIFDVLAKLLTNGKSSRLVKKLVIQEKIVQNIRAYTGIPGNQLPNHFSFFISAYSEKDYPKIMDMIYEEISTLKEKGPSMEELQRVKNRTYASLLSSLNSNAGLADSITYYEVLLNDYKKFFTFLEEMGKVHPEDIQKILQTYFITENNTTVQIKKPSG